MATTVSPFSIYGHKSLLLLPSSSSSIESCRLLPLHRLRFRTQCGIATSYSPVPLPLKRFSRIKRIRSVAEEETLVPEGDGGAVATEEAAGDDASSSPPVTADQTVSVPVSASDVLTMFFHAEGTMSDAAIPKVTKALEETEGITDLKVRVLEGLASVDLTKQTTIQATGVASSLVEIIQGSGFKLQTLNLSFQDEEDLI
nr:metal ion binding protein [Ipomoea batatas]